MMAEGGMLDGLLGEDLTEGELSAATADPVAITVALDAARHGDITGDAAAFLRAQRELVEAQAAHFADERADLRRQTHLKTAAAHIHRWTDRVRLALLVAAAGLVTALAAGVVAMVWNAAHDHGVEIAAFSVPPDLAARGLTGTVVASMVQDRLVNYQAETHSTRAERSFANNWGKDIKVEIPETGVSIAELSRLLHDNLGHGSHIDGEVFRTAAGVTIAARSEGHVTTASGADVNLDTLIDQVAQGVYEQTQPYRYGKWLALHGNVAKAADIFQTLIAGDDPVDHYWGLIGVSHTHPPTTAGLRLAVGDLRKAVMIQPHSPVAWSSLAFEEWVLGHDEPSLRAAQRGLLEAKTGSRDLNPGLAYEYLRQSAMFSDQALQDWSKVSADVAAGPAATGPEKTVADRFGWYARIRRHEEPELPLPSTQTAPLIADIRKNAAYTRGSWAQLALAVEADEVALAPGDELNPRDRAWRADAYGHLGRFAEAEADLRALPADRYDGWTTRGIVAALRHDWAGSDRAFAEAVGQAPSLPLAFKLWGDALVSKGDLAGAVAKYAIANAKGSHWADPLKAWGDVLARQGMRAEARAKYNTALPFAPKWEALRVARARIA